ncbi:hypothetical protein [Marinobacterium litorale]|uniref:hypothetical protein n=1 Tax=Marinobacterium litorale TaxID=404770 RepID=UPI000487F873|nr:hypothetical protein [Marinobacterium litorale]
MKRIWNNFKSLITALLLVLAVGVTVAVGYFLTIIIGIGLIVSLIYILIREYHRSCDEENRDDKPGGQ